MDDVRNGWTHIQWNSRRITSHPSEISRWNRKSNPSVVPSEVCRFWSQRRLILLQTCHLMFQVHVIFMSCCSESVWLHVIIINTQNHSDQDGMTPDLMIYDPWWPLGHMVSTAVACHVCCGCAGGCLRLGELHGFIIIQGVPESRWALAEVSESDVR